MVIKLPWLKRNGGDHVATIEEAQKILGNHVCTLEEVFAQREEKAHLSVSPLFLTKTLQLCAKQNKKKWANWWLVYVIGFCTEALHNDPKTSHHFFPQHLFWEHGDHQWTKSSTESGYWLINFKPRFCNQSIDAQARELVAFGPEYERTPENVFAAALFSIYDCKGVRLCERYFHQGNHARLGYFDEKGLLIFYPNVKHLCRKDTGVMMCVNPHKQIPE